MSVNTLSNVSDDELKAGGPALKVAIHVAREKVEIPSDRQLAFRAGVSYDTLMNWFAARTVPRPAELTKVANVLGVRLVELMDVYEGRDAEPPGLIEAMWSLVDELRILIHEVRLSRASQEEGQAAVLRALGVAARTIPALRETPGGSEPAPRGDSRRP